MLLINCWTNFIPSHFRYDQKRRNADMADCEYNDDKGYVNFKSFFPITIN